MSDLLIPDLDERVLARLKQSAAAHQRSVEQEARAVLIAAAMEGKALRPAVLPEPGVAGRPKRGTVRGLGAYFAPGEDIAPVFPDGIPWHDQDPV